MNNSITIHSADWPNGKSLDITDIDRWHGERGFKRQPEDIKRFNSHLKHVGYHYFIKLNGEVQTGRHTDELGSHVKGHNTNNIGICLAGRDKFTTSQWSALKLLVADLMSAYPIVRVSGHRDYSPDKNGDGVIQPSEWMKTCPGFEVSTWFANNMTPDIKNILEEPTYAT